MAVYYNEHDANAAAWLRELMRQRWIADGDVDERSIEEVRPSDLTRFTQCHFFAGIGVWSYALRRAGWSDDHPVWTGSCPCQSFSAGGKREGFSDPRHLWPAWFRLIRECRPDVLFGEQVASQDGLAWLDIVSADLEGAGYAVGACDLCAAAVGAPHIRQRIFFVGESDGSGSCARREATSGDGYRRPAVPASDILELAESHDAQRRTDVASRDECNGSETGRHESHGHVGASGKTVGVVANPEASKRGRGDEETGRPGLTNGFWEGADWIPCTDGKARPVEPGTFPLAHGAPARVVRLRGYGNAINAEVAKTFIEAYQESRGETKC